MPWPPASRLPHLYLSNLPPSEIEVNLISNVLSSAESDLSNIRDSFHMEWLSFHMEEWDSFHIEWDSFHME